MNPEQVANVVYLSAQRTGTMQQLVEIARLLNDALSQLEELGRRSYTPYEVQFCRATCEATALAILSQLPKNKGDNLSPSEDAP